MAKEILKIRIDNGLGDNNPTFKDIELDDYSGKFPRMGFPELTATLMWPTPLDDEWTHKEYVVLRGEKFYVTDTPDAEKTNDKIPYRHDIGFTSEFARILGNTYFEDAVSSYSATYDKPCSNSSKFTFYGTIAELCDRLNCSFIKAGIADSVLKTKTSLSTLDTPVGDGYCVMLDPYGVGNIYDPNKTYEFSWEDKTHWEAITEGFNITEIPFERRGKAIVFGAIPKVVEHKFEYGHDNELLSVAHKNAKAKVINRITMFGSPDNIPYYYPNETEYGHISIAPKTGNNVLTTANVEIANMTQLLSRLNADSFAVLGKYDGEDVGNAKVSNLYYQYAFDESVYSVYTLGDQLKHNPTQSRDQKAKWHIRVRFDVTEAGVVVCSDVRMDVWAQNDARPTETANCVGSIIPEMLYPLDDPTSPDYSNQIEKKENAINLGYLPKGVYYFQFHVLIPNHDSGHNGSGGNITSFCSLSSITFEAAEKQKTGYYWAVGDKKYDGVGALGVKINATITDAMIGDGFGWVASGRMPFQDHLVPPKYRNTLGTERFYNALNAPYSETYASAHPDAYIDPDTNNPYVFPNPFIEGAPSEYIHKNEDIKPTIGGVTNASGQLMGVIADIAYDADDNDALKTDSTEDNDKNDSLKYEHSFFYIKLNIFNGPYGFDLFAHASQTDAMTIQMREGSCNGCKFKIQALEYEDETGLKSYKNPVQTTGANGNIVSGSYADKVKEDWQEWQQNTQTHSIWICVQKDAETFGVIMPNKANNFKPKVGDTFNIINIDLPQGYILAAEKRLEEEGMRYMADNNEEKFTFDISASRIFFAEHPEVLAQLDEYSVIKVKYNGKVYEQYVNQLTIDCKSNEALPNIGIDLTDTLAVGQSFVEQVAERASSLISNAYTMGGALGGGSGSGGGLTTRLADLRYLKKTEADRSKGKVASDIGFEVGEFVSGGSGAILYQDPETGQTYLEVDKIKARMKAIFAELEVAKEQSIGGKFDITPGGGIDISFVEETATSYRCYFKAKDEDKGADCRFVVGDQARCQESNIANGTMQNASNRYYWRLVTAVNNNESYIELSKTDCDTGSDAPMAGDTIVQLGNRNDPERQSAIVLSTVDAFAPCVTLYNGIDHYSLDGKAVVEYGVDKSKNPPEPFFNCYGRFFFGPKGGNSYLKFEPSVGKLIFSGELINISTLNGKDIDEYIKGVVPPVTQEDIEDFVEAIVDPKIEDIQNQIDGVIETWFGDGAPSLDRTEYPMNQWGDSTDEAHSGDLYYDNTTGYAYRFSKVGDTWQWVMITDEAITKALAAAKEAKDLADGKRRVFTSQPTANDVYDEGDLWVNATYGTQYSNDILRCITPKAKGEAFNISHWTLASKYTDDSALNQFISDYEDTIVYIKGQLDGKAETWYQPTDPSTAWETKDYLEHKGDLWYNTTNGTTWYWDGSQWQQQDVPESVFDAIDGKADIFVSKPENGYHKNDLWFLEAEYTLYDGAHKAGTLAVALRDMGTTFSLNDWAKKDRYTDDTKAQQAIDDIAGFQYIRDALVNGATIFNGGLILSQLIKLGTWNKDNPSDPTQKAVYAGMNGGYHHAKTIASWWGGDMVDKYYNDSVTPRPNPLATGFAQALIRMDGSGYLAGGNIRWDELGNLILGNGISLGGGSTTIGDVANLFDTVESVTLLFNKFSQALVPIKLVNGTPTETNWADIEPDLSNLHAVKSKKGFYSDSFISARGLNPDGSSGGGGATQLRMLTDVLINDSTLSVGQALVYNGSKWVNQAIQSGGLDESALAAYLTTNNYATHQWVNSQGFLKSVAWGDVTGKPSWIGASKPSYAFSELTSHPTTIAGYGITDAYTKTEADNRYVNISGDTMTGLLTLNAGAKVISGQKLVIGDCEITWDATNGGLKFTKGIYSDSFVSARGVNPDGGGGTNFNRLDSWSNYNPNGTDVLSATLGYGLKTRIDALEDKNYLNDLAISVTGAGNAVTSVTQSADKKLLTFTKGATFVTSQSLADYLPLAGGTMSNTNLVTNLNADMLDGYHYNRFVPKSIYNPSNGVLVTTSIAQSKSKMLIFRIVGHTYETKLPIDTIVQIYPSQGSTFFYGPAMLNNGYKLPYVKVFYADNVVKMWIPYVAQYSSYDVYCYDSMGGSGTNLVTAISDSADVSGSGTAALQINPQNSALISDNVASATKLSDNSSYKAWGQTFFENGVPKSVSGNISGCTRIFNETNDNIYLGNSNNTGWILTQDICSHNAAGDTYWSLRVDGTAHFKKVIIGNCTITYENGGLHFSSGIYSDSFVSARGVNSSGGSTGGGLIQKVYGSGSLGGSFSDSTMTDTFNAFTINKLYNDKADKTWVESKGYLTSITKAQVEAVLTGVITSHTHNSIKDAGDGRVLQFNYSANALGYDAFTWVAVWNGSTLQCVNKNVFATSSALANYVTLSTEQTITGAKTFSSAITQSQNNNSSWWLSTAPRGKFVATNGGTATGWSPAFAFKTTKGKYEIGSLDDTAYINYYLDTRTANGIDHQLTIPKKGGTLAVTSDIPTKVSQLTNDSGYALASSLGSYLPLSGGTLTGALLMGSGVAAASASQPTALSYGRLQCYGTLNINGNTDNSGTEYVNITAGHGLSSSTADGLSIGTDTLTWKNNPIIHSANIGSYAITSHQPLTNYVDKTSAQEISGLKSFTAGLKVSGRVIGAGDDEGIVVGRASNNYAGLCLGTPNGIRSVFYLMPNDKAIWSYNNGSSSYNIYHPEKAGTIALTADISLAVANYVPLSSYTDANVLAKIKNVDGSGSGLDADLLDGKHSSAFLGVSDNAVSATKLLTTRTIWGQSFNGEGDVTGNLTLGSGNAIIGGNSVTILKDYANNNVTLSASKGDLFIGYNYTSNVRFYSGNTAGTGTEKMILRANGHLSIGTTTDSYALNTASFICDSWIRTIGSTGWYNETYGGGWYMSDTTWVRTYNQKSIYTGSGAIRSDYLFDRRGYTGASWNNGYGAYNVAITNNDSQTPLMVAYRDGDAPTATGANRLFAMELLNNGGQVNFAFGGGSKFTMSSAGNLTASTNITANGSLVAGGSVTAGNSITAAGNITSSLGNITASAGNITASAGSLIAVGGLFVGSSTSEQVADMVHLRKSIIAGNVNMYFAANSYANTTGVGFSPYSDHLLVFKYKATRAWESNIARFYVDGTFWARTGIWSDGYVSARGQNTSSDENLKFLERRFTIDIKKIANAPSWCFKWKSDGKEDVGSLAQYWQRINPLLTPKMPDGTLTLQYGKTALLGLISVAKKTLSHEEEIKQLKEEVKRLNKRIAQLERK